MRHQDDRPRGGFTLIEMLFAIGITAIAGGVAVAMIVAVARLADGSAATPQRVARAAEFGRLLRADAAAASAASAEGGTLLLSGDRDVVYAAEDGVVSRGVDGRPPENFPFAGDVRFSTAGRLVRVDVAAPPDSEVPVVPYRFDAAIKPQEGPQ